MNLVIAGTMIRNRRISQSMSSMCHWYIRERQRTDDSAQRYARRKRCPFRLCTIETTLCCLQQKYESLQIRVLPITPYLNSLFWEVHDKEYKMSFRSTVWTCVPVHLYRRFLAQSSISVINWASQVRFFFCLNACCLSDKILWSFRCSMIFEFTMCSICKEYLSMRLDNNYSPKLSTLLKQKTDTCRRPFFWNFTWV